MKTTFHDKEKDAVIGRYIAHIFNKLDNSNNTFIALKLQIHFNLIKRSEFITLRRVHDWQT